MRFFIGSKVAQEEKRHLIDLSYVKLAELMEYYDIRFGFRRRMKNFVKLPWWFVTSTSTSVVGEQSSSSDNLTRLKKALVDELIVGYQASEDPSKSVFIKNRTKCSFKSA